MECFKNLGNTKLRVLVFTQYTNETIVNTNYKATEEAVMSAKENMRLKN
jgi:hypothetical protein